MLRSFLPLLFLPVVACYPSVDDVGTAQGAANKTQLDTSAAPKCTALPASAPLTMMATAPIGVSEAQLGRPLDAHFEPFAGTDGATLFPKGSVRKQELHQMEHQIVTMDTKRSWDANIGVSAKTWGVSASGGKSNEMRYASYRASQLEGSREIDDATEMRRAPSGAVWYISRIYYGRSYELVFSGEARSFTASVKARLFVASGGGKTFGSEKGISVTAHGRGLAPANGQAIFATSAEEIEKAYKQSGEAVPVAVEYRSIPRACVPEDETIAWLEPHRVRLTFDRIDVFRSPSDGWTLDAKCRVNDKEILVDPESIWKEKAGLATTCTSDVPGPRGGKSYCPYNLYWATTLDVMDGDRVRCGIEGSLGSGPSAKKLPYGELSEVVSSSMAPITSTFGDGDASTEYRVAYSLRAEPATDSSPK